MRYFYYILLIMCAMPQTCGALEITFHKTASVKGSVITLGDIAGFDEKSELAQALGSQTIGQSPAPGETVSLRSLAIERYLLSTQPLPGDVTWQGAAIVRLKRKGITIGADKILRIIREFIADNKENLPDAEISFLPANLPLPFTLPVGKLSFEVIPSHPAILGSSRFSIIFRVDNRVVKNMSVRGKVKAIADVVIAAKMLRRGCVLLPEYLKKARMDISSIAGEHGGYLDEFVGKKLKRSVRAGSLILPSMVEAQPVVRSGEKVKIVISRGPMILTATGLAYSNGQKNQMIRVQNLNSRKIIYCRVTAPGLVEVLL